MANKSKPVKLPGELIEKLQVRNQDRPPGEVLLEIVEDYERLEQCAKIIAEQGNIDMHGKTVSQVVSWFLAEISSTTEEMKKVLSGLRLFYDKSNKWKQGQK